MNDKTLAMHFSALAHPRRALIFRVLALRPELGANQKTLLDATAIPYASFAHHMARLERAGLIRRRASRRGVSYEVSPGAFADSMRTALRLSESAGPRPARAA